MASHSRRSMPALATTEIEMPQTVRRTYGSVMAAEWTDPDDIRPNAARQARVIRGWRSYCPLRRMIAIRGSSVTAQHILAADKLREQADVARLGLSPVRDMVYIPPNPGPRPGPSVASHAQVAAARELNRAMARFTTQQRRMLTAIVLQNRSIRNWTQEERNTGARRADPNVETGRLLAVLDILVDHYGFEVEQEVRAGKRLAV